MPFFLPTAATLNTHIVWGLYRSVIAYNNPDNTRESLASVYIHGLQVADIETLKIPRLQAQAQAPVASDQGLGNDTTHLTPTSALQTLSKLDHRPKAGAMMAGDAAGFKLHWVLVARGETIRRETAYDAVAYAILWTSQYDQGASARGTRTLSVPGGDVFVRFVAYPPESRIPTLTIGFFATIANSIPKFLEASERFQEGFVQVLTANGQACGLIGIWKRGSAGDLASALPMNPTSPKLSAMSDTGQAQDN